MIGVAIAKRVWPENTPEWEAANEERRVYDHQSNLWLKLEGAADITERYLTLCKQYRREQEVFRAQIVEAGGIPILRHRCSRVHPAASVMRHQQLALTPPDFEREAESQGPRP
jgi:hypothetical protein